MIKIIIRLVVIFCVSFIFLPIIGVPFEVCVLVEILFVGILSVIEIKPLLDDSKRNRQSYISQIKQELERKEIIYNDYIERYNSCFEKYKNNRFYYDDGYRHYCIINDVLFVLSYPKIMELMDISKTEEEIIEKKYPISFIKYYKIEGDLYREQNISGGGGGGSSIKGAVIGGMVAGDVGAIIGSRNKIEDIKTTHETKDDRRLVITFNNYGTIVLSKNYFDRLFDCIPEKEYENYLYFQRRKTIDNIQDLGTKHQRYIELSKMLYDLYLSKK